jgi:hypothetical protein
MSTRFDEMEKREKMRFENIDFRFSENILFEAGGSEFQGIFHTERIYL